MATTVIRTEGLTKRYGDRRRPENLDLEVARRRGPRLPRPERCGQDDDDPPAARAHPAHRPVAPRSSGSTASAKPSRPTAGLAYVAGEANLWPSLTGAETLHLLGRVQGRVDEAYRDELIARFDLDPSKKVRAYSKGNRQKLILIAALMCRPRLLAPRRADERARPA